MRVRFDGRIFEAQVQGGISRYFTELCLGLIELGVDVDVDCLFSANIHAIAKGICRRRITFPEPRIDELLARLYLQINRLYRRSFPFPLPDIYHSTYHDVDIDIPPNSKLITTVYDMIYEDYPDLFPENRISEIKKKLCLQSTRIIAISHSTKNRLVDLFNLDPHRVEVVYLANGVLRTRDVFRLNLPNEYLLFVGSRSGYKNFDRFARAVQIVFDKVGSGLSVVCVGKPFDSNEYMMLSQLNILDRFTSIFPCERDLSEIYQRAKCFVFPSYAEGFGLPILEAFSNCCPVLLSDINVFHEVARDAAEYFSPFDIDSIAHQICNVLGSQQRQDDLRNLGNERSSEFSWEKTAISTRDCYLAALKDNSLV